MLKNMKIKKSLILGFGLSIIISAILVIISLFMMSSLSGGFQDVINRDIQANQIVTDIRLNANIAARNVRDMALTPDDPANPELEAQARSAVTQMNNYITDLRNVWPLDEASLNSYVAAIEDWEEEIPQILDAIDSNRISQAVDLIYNNCTPALNKMAEIGGQLDDTLTDRQEDAVAKQQRSVTITIIILVALTVVAGIILMLLATKLIKSIVEPTEQVRSALVGFSKGKLDIPVEYESKNELGEMCEALRTSQKVLDAVIKDACRLLEEMGGGNFNVRTEAEKYYVGELSDMLKSIRIINHSLSDTLTQISLSGEQVSSGSDQVSTGAQSLAQGATEQASAVQELAATINDISANAQKTATAAEEAGESVGQVVGNLNVSVSYVSDLNKAMENISSSSQEISKIIATIENIAFQTNILALNAAVEAARAGSAGKGFAVVADEVRNLATKSDQAAKATKELIESSIAAVTEGSEVVDKVTHALETTNGIAGGVSSRMQIVVEAVENQTTAIAQITEGIDQISSVVQTNSATSEQSAAASEELSSQASLMKDLLSKFRLRSESGSSSYSATPSYSDTSAADTSYDSGYSSGGSAFSKY